MKAGFKLYAREDVEAALNRAADHVLEAIDAPDEGKRDVANLIVNATAHYLDHPEATLTEAIEAADYDSATPDEVLDWCRS
jgi:hypothetical protein